MTFEDTIRRTIHVESEEDLGDTPFTYYLDADVGDTVFVCEDADVYMREDKNGWAIYWHNNLMDMICASDEDDKETYIKKYRQAQKRYETVCNASLDGTLEKECLSGDENGQPSFDYSNAAEVFKQFGESKGFENVFASILRESNGASSSGLKFIISSYASEEDYKGDNAWRLKEKKAMDEALGIGHDKRFSLEEVKQFVSEVQEKFKKFLDDNETNERIIKHTVDAPEVRDNYFHPMCTIRFNFADHYEDGCVCGSYQELCLMIDFESLASYFN